MRLMRQMMTMRRDSVTVRGVAGYCRTLIGMIGARALRVCQVRRHHDRGASDVKLEWLFIRAFRGTHRQDFADHVGEANGHGQPVIEVA